ncbi:fimbrial biogenesis outer membrane usher protein (plasmid) [Enterobacter soli]|uniref:fimbria/pilus outer membrane usher protein n=1 Tax=Enterobacter soli TaxID=885040 RepID=UPI000223CFE6|nr:fimbria/pilus outer membrane usher protein [Enterobacter soli]AEN67287.1 fimbrial biogenesis outer membrane usher protein [Enterobacter soli]OAT34935.1 FimD family fimbriae anchoring protein [Enterobacter soli ATCC BAA-2102]
MRDVFFPGVMARHDPDTGRRRLAVLIMLLCGAAAGPVQAEDYFNPALLGLGTSGTGSDRPRTDGIDEAALARLARGEQLPGIYPVEIRLNDTYVESRDVAFREVPGTGRLAAALSVNDALYLGLRASAFDGSGIQTDPEHAAIPVPGLLEAVPGARARFDFARGRLDLTVPEIYLAREESGAVDARFWDEGLTAAMTDYNFSASHTRARGADSAGRDGGGSYFLSLNNGVNLGAWQLRNFSTLTLNTLTRSTDRTDSGVSRTTRNWNAINTWVQRPVAPVKGLLTVGDGYTPSEVFDSVQFRGVQLASDDDMYTDRQRSFAPVIRGTASSNARVTVSQNGNVIYQTTVAPGPFEISDLNSSSLSGDLYVTVREADGTTHSFVQGFSSVAVMQREGQLRYGLTAGRYRNSGQESRTPQFAQGSLIYGLPYDITLYGGGLFSDDYQAWSLGSGTGLGVFGALSADVTQSYAVLPGDRQSDGQSWRLRYSKGVPETGTTVTLAAYRYSTQGYYSFRDASVLAGNNSTVTSWTPDGVWSTPVINGRSRQSLELNLTQRLGDIGSLSLSGSRKTYWDLDDDQRSVSLNYSVTARRVSYSLGYMLSAWPGSDRKNDRQISLNIQLPLQDWLMGSEWPHSLWANYGMTHDDTGRTAHSAGIGGTALEDNRLSWGASQSLVSGGENGVKDTNNGALNGSYSGGRGKVSAGYSYGRDQQQLSYGLQGGVVATRYGVTLSQSLGETLALVRAPGADGVRVENTTGARTDGRGYTVMTSLQPYRRNRVSLDPLSAGPEVTLGINSQTVTPLRGAVVLASFTTAVGRQVLFTLTRHGSPLPFGTTVTLVQAHSDSDAQGQRMGIAGDAGQVYMSGMPDEGILSVAWGEGAEGQCRIPYRLTAADMAAADAERLPVIQQGECP